MSERSKIPGETIDVSRIEFQNIEAVVRSNEERLIRLEGQIKTLTREIAELTRVIAAMRSGR